MNFKLLSLLVLVLTSFSLQSQFSIVKLDESASDGLTFYSAMGNNRASYLFNNCGEIINKWTHTTRTGLSGRLLDNGLVLRAGKIQSCCPQYSDGGLLELIDWDNKVVWSYAFANEKFVQHHDFSLMPNGNILFVGWEIIDTSAQVELGKADIVDDLWGEFLYEITPIGNNDMEIVWEWHLKDHLIQDRVHSLSNFANIKSSIGKIDINYAGPGWWSSRDWWHCNAIDYNPERDEILINSRNNNELWIIDHSTTSEEAKGNTGGNRNKGGQIIFRWGNPEAYDSGNASDLRMFGSHGHYWIPKGYPNEGKIMFFNNGHDRPGGFYSTVDILDPSYNQNSNYHVNMDNKYLVNSHVVVYGDNPVSQPLFSSYLSNGKQLMNGNVLINAGGRILEVDSNKNIVWEILATSSVFRAYKFLTDYSGFQGQDLTVKDQIPNPILGPCMSSGVDELLFEDIQISPNPVSDILTVKLNSGIGMLGEIYDITGQRLGEVFELEVNKELDVSTLHNGMYYLRFYNSSGSVLQRFVKL